MKSYPSISTKVLDSKIIMFDKLDGSNVRAEWSKKKGFYKFGSRTQLIDSSHPILGEAVDLILQNEKQLSAIFTAQNWERAVPFFEFHGTNSFAGSHEQEEHKVTLIDVDVYKRGIMDPVEFINLFAGIEMPNVLHNGVLTESIVTDIKNGTLPDMTFEGVVCKYYNKKNRTVKMFKIKNRNWIEKLKEKCKDDEALFKKLA